MPTEAPRLHHGLKAGEKYKFVYQIPGVHRKPRTGIALYMMQDHPAGRHGVDLIFSGRPQFGTTTIQSEWLQSIEMMPPETPNHIDRIVR